MNAPNPPLSELTEHKPIRGRSPAYSTFLPFLMVLTILIFSSAKDVLTLIKRKNALRVEQAQAIVSLRFAGKQAEFIGSIHEDLVKLAASDPTAAHIVTDFFPPPPPTLPMEDETHKESKSENRGTSR